MAMFNQDDRLRILASMDTFAGVPENELARLNVFPEQTFAKDEILMKEGEVADRLIIVFDGEFRVLRSSNDNEQFLSFTHVLTKAPAVTGEVGLITEMSTPFTRMCSTEAHGIVVSKEDFWHLMAECPGLRSAILRLSSARLTLRRDFDLREEKLASLGTLTAGLMHELNNPGAAAGRAAAQLRENLNRMHELAKVFAEMEHSTEQGRCLWGMQERVLGRKKISYMNSLEQSDAEEALVEWMESNGVHEAWRLAATFASSGISAEELNCLKEEFKDGNLSEPLAWIEAMVGSMQMVDTIEESINRVSALVKAVKTYTHEGQGQSSTINVNESIYSTIVILKHKMRERGTRLTKEFAPDLIPLVAKKSSLNQVWTNLIDNAIDAAGDGGEIGIKTWQSEGEIFVSVSDNGPGIPLEQQKRIFDPFYTTKPAGVGTGLGLGIAFQIVREYGGEIHFSSGEGRTSFVVHLPAVMS